MAPLSQTHDYRADIDGLRAVAVLSVLGYHAFPELLPGGFVGVDIFFVISGFLISRIIFLEVDRGTFSFTDFYSRRVRRIFPALAVVVGTCLVAGVCFLLPAALAQLGLHAAAGAAFASNILLWSQAGYFDGASAAKPLLHLWSLGIEEQYYLFWPLVLAIVGARRKWRLTVIVFIALFSMALNLKTAGVHPVADFYLPVTRFWELLMGALLAFWSLSRRGSYSVSSRLQDVLSIVGLVLVGIALVFVKANDEFPGKWALLPTTGALLLIASGSGALMNRHLLSSRAAVFFGLISYPLYLWHWPVLVLPKLMGIAVPGYTVAAILLSVGLAWMTFKFVELPVRTLNRQRTTFALMLTMIAIAAGGFFLYCSKGLPQRFPAEVREVATAAQDFDYREYREGQCFLEPGQGPNAFSQSCLPALTSPNDSPLILLWGDSHAASLWPGLSELGAERKLRLAQFTASSCPPVIGFVVTARPHCKDINDYVKDVIQRTKPATVVMLASWSFYSGKVFDRLDFSQIRVTIDFLHDAGVAQVLLVGPLPRWDGPQPDIILEDWSRAHHLVLKTFSHFDSTVSIYDEIFERSIKGSAATYISPIKSLCNASGCPAVIESGSKLYPLAWDDAHLTSEGSLYAVRSFLGPYLR